MAYSSKHLMIIAGEASGDLHAAHLVQSLKEQDNQLTFSGLGGSHMQNAGVELFEDLTKIAVVGFVEVLKHFGEFRRIFYDFLEEVDERKPDAVILVDYPGFNLRMAKELKKRGVKVFYYISPQVWAWKENRVYQIDETVDRMLVLFEFERDFYAKYEVDVDFVGHPLIDTVKATKTKEELLSSTGLNPSGFTIGILPGSRTKEIQRMLPPMVEAAKILHQENSQIQFLLMKAGTVSNTLLDEFLPAGAFPLRIIDNDTYNGIHACDICMVTSGTATLETAILNKPMVVVYKTNMLTYLIAKYLIKIDCIAMANVVAGKKIIPECIQGGANKTAIARELRNIFKDEIKIAEIKDELEKVKQSLGTGGASQRAAEIILKHLAL